MLIYHFSYLFDDLNDICLTGSDSQKYEGITMGLVLVEAVNIKFHRQMANSLMLLTELEGAHFIIFANV